MTVFLPRRGVGLFPYGDPFSELNGRDRVNGGGGNDRIFAAARGRIKC